MFLIGKFNREHSHFFDDINGLVNAFIIDAPTKSHLTCAKEDEDYQVINLETLEYFNPEENKWIKIRKVENSKP